MLKKKGTWALARSTIEEVVLELHDSVVGWTSIWSTLGLLSTLSHGVFLLASAPTWLISGVSIGIASAYAPDRAVQDRELDELYQYARFPGGIPSGWSAQEVVGAPPGVEIPHRP